jgi:hypothetical protein
MKAAMIIVLLIVLLAIAVPVAGYLWLCTGIAHGAC